MESGPYTVSTLTDVYSADKLDLEHVAPLIDKYGFRVLNCLA